MTINLENAKKNAVMNTFKKVVDNTGNRPVLGCINFSKDGNMVATNSHVLLKIEGTHKPTKHDLLFNLSQGVPMGDVNYPNTDRVIPDNSENTVTIKSDSFPVLILWLKALGKKELVSISMNDKNELVFTCDNNPAINFSIGNNDIYMEKHDSDEVSVKGLEYTGKLDKLNILCNAHYLLWGLQLYRDIKASYITFGFGSDQETINLRPLTMISEQFTYVVTPRRRY